MNVARPDDSCSSRIRSSTDSHDTVLDYLQICDFSNMSSTVKNELNDLFLYKAPSGVGGFISLYRSMFNN